MNKYEFKSAYNKITLSDSFKADAKARLMEMMDGNGAVSLSDGVEEQHTAGSIRLTEKSGKPWKMIAGIGSAAAVVGLGIWGGIVLTQDSPIIDPADSSEISQPDESSDPVIDYNEKYSLLPETVSFPAYLDNRTEYNSYVFDVLPFELSISLPEDWRISIPEGEERTGGFSRVDITDVYGNDLGDIDFFVYEPQPDMPYVGIYNQIMLNSMVSWDNEYTPVKQEEGFTSATCFIRSDDPEYSQMNDCGILAHSDELGAYVQISIDSEIVEPELHTAIAKSVELSPDLDGIASRVAEDYIDRKPLTKTISAFSAQLSDGRLIAVANGEEQKYSTVLYYLSAGKLYTFEGLIAEDIKLYDSENGALIQLGTGGTVGDSMAYYTDVFYSIGEDNTLTYLGGTERTEINGEITKCSKLDPNDINSIIPCTHEEYLAEKIRFMQGYALISEYSFDNFTAHGGSAASAAKIIEAAMYAKPDTEPIEGINSENMSVALDIAEMYLEVFSETEAYLSPNILAEAVQTSDGTVVFVKNDRADPTAKALFAVKHGKAILLNPYENTFRYNVYDSPEGTIIKTQIIQHADDVNGMFTVDSEHEDMLNSMESLCIEEYFTLDYEHGLTRIAMFEFIYNSVTLRMDSIFNHVLYENHSEKEKITEYKYNSMVEELLEGYTNLNPEVGSAGSASGDFASTEELTAEALAEVIRHALNDASGTSYEPPSLMISCDDYRTGLSHDTCLWKYEGSTREVEGQSLDFMYENGFTMYLPVYEGHEITAELENGGTISEVALCNDDGSRTPLDMYEGNIIRFPAEDIGKKLYYAITVSYPQGEVTSYFGAEYCTMDEYEKRFDTDLMIEDDVLRSANKDITSVSIDSTVRRIAEDAFKNCTKLKSVTTLYGNEWIGDRAFRGCTSLSRVIFSDTLTYIGPNAFEGCTALDDVILPAGITTIHKDSFSGCTSLESLTLPEGLESIDSGAFRNCTSLKKLTLPDSVKSVAQDSFDGCRGLVITYRGKNYTYELFDTLGSDIEYWDRADKNGLVIENGYLVYAMSWLTGRVTVPDDITGAETSFAHCKDIRVTFRGKTYPNAASTYKFQLDVAYWDSADKNGLVINPLTNSLTHCMGWAGREIYVPEGVTEIATGALSYTKNITKITLPSTLTRIEDRAFAECTALREVVLPDGLTYIGSMVFDGTAITRLELPDSLTQFYSDAIPSGNGVTLTYRGNTYTESTIKDLCNVVLNSVPPVLYMSVQGNDWFPLTQGSYKWNNGSDVTERTVSPYKTYKEHLLSGSSDFDTAAVDIPDGAKISRIYSVDEKGTQEEVLFTTDGVITIPYHTEVRAYAIFMEFPQGTCEYLFYTSWTVECGTETEEDFLNSLADLPEPPDLYINDIKLYRAGYQWNTKSDGAKTFTTKDAVACAEEGLLPLIKTDGYRLSVDGIEKHESHTGHISKIYAQDSEGRISNVEYSLDTIHLSEVPAGNIYTLTVEYTQGICTYYFMTDEEIQEQLPVPPVLTYNGQDMFTAGYWWNYYDQSFNADAPSALQAAESGMIFCVIPRNKGTLKIADLGIPMGGRVTQVTAYGTGSMGSLNIDISGGNIALINSPNVRVYSVHIVYPQGNCTYYFMTE